MTRGRTAEDEQCQRIGGRYEATKARIFTVSPGGANMTYADPESG
jgi:hypothetical protein